MAETLGISPQFVQIKHVTYKTLFSSCLSYYEVTDGPNSSVVFDTTFPVTYPEPFVVGEEAERY